MRVLVVAPYASWTPHYETDLEICERHLIAGDDVLMLTCSADLPLCDPNRDHGVSGCLRCIGRRNVGLRQLSGPVRVEPLLRLTPAQREEIRNVRAEFSTVDELKGFTVDNLDIGWGVLSTLVDWTRDPYPDLVRESNRRIVRSLMRAALSVYRSTRNYLRQERIEQAYVFNGRFAIVRAVLRASQAESVTCYTHDRGCDFNHFALYRNSLPVDIGMTRSSIQESWESADASERVRFGRQFYEERVEGTKQNWLSFTDQQDKDALPSDWMSSRRNIAIFTSSEEEFAAIGEEWQNPIYEHQLDGVRRIVADSVNRQDIHLYIRIHPNQRGVQNDYARAVAGLRASNVTVIPPESPVSSYRLLLQADSVLTFGSTIGIEATYWGKPSILAGQCFYRHLNATYNPETHEEVMRLLASDTLPAKPIEGAVMYGFYMKTFGERFRYFEGLDVLDGLFKGVRITPTSPYSVALHVLRCLRPIRTLARGVSTWSSQRANGAKLRSHSSDTG
jgi:hypothetical protein